MMWLATLLGSVTVNLVTVLIVLAVIALVIWIVRAVIRR